MRSLKYINKIYFFILIFVFTSCVNENVLNSSKNFEKFYWLEGNWAGEMNNGIYYESWKKESSELISGRSYFIEGSDTILSEKSSINRNYKGIFYSVKVGNENEVNFQLIEITDVYSIFENMYNEFPQRIIYIKKDNNTLLAKIEGKVNGKITSNEFRLKRQK